MNRLTALALAIILTPALLLGLTACGSGDGNESTDREPTGKTVLESTVSTYEIRPFKEPCQREPRDFCLVADDSTGVTKRLYSDIEGLPFRWGWSRTAQIQADRIEDSPGGQQRYEYKLVQLLNEVSLAKDQQFEINVDKNDVAPSESCDFQLLDETGFRSPDSAVCSKFNAELVGGLPTRAVFAFTGDDNAPIELVDVKSPIIPAE